MEKIIKCPECNEKFQVPSEEYINFICSNCGVELEYNSHLKVNQKQRTYNKKRINNRKKEKKNSFFIDLIFNLLSLLITIPFFIILHKLLPNPDWAFNMDRVIIGVSLITIIIIMVNLFKKIFVFAITISFFYLLYGSIWEGYGFGRVCRDYSAMIYTINNSPKLNKISVTHSVPSKLYSQIKSAIDFDNPSVRNFAVGATAKHFDNFAKNADNNERALIQYFAVFKEINSKWRPLSDPPNNEYFAKASETVKNIRGDCDDHSIFMAACIKSIGGTTRLIHTTGHLYPELLIESKNDLETANYLINEELFAAESIKSNGLHYHIDSDGRIWLNLDYTAKYPGAPFMREEVLGIIDNY